MKKFMFGTFILLFVVAISCVGGVKRAEASTMTLQISDDNFITSASDTDVSQGTPGMVQFNAAYNSWIVNVVTGLGAPIIGPLSDPDLDLNSVNVSGAAGSIWLSLNQTHFNTLGTGLTGLTADLGGTTDGSVDFWYYIGTDNDDDWTNGDTLFASSLGNGSGAFAATLQDNLASLPAVDFALTIVAKITHGRAGDISSFDTEIEAVPEPGTIALLGIGLAGLVGVGARRRAKKKAA